LASSSVKTGHFHFGENRTFLFWLDIDGLFRLTFHLGMWHSHFEVLEVFVTDEAAKTFSFAAFFIRQVFLKL